MRYCLWGSRRGYEQLALRRVPAFTLNAKAIARVVMQYEYR